MDSIAITPEMYSPDLRYALAQYSNERNCTPLLDVLMQYPPEKENLPEVSLILMQMMRFRHPDIKEKLGRFFQKGIGVNRNAKIAQTLFDEAIANGSKAALVDKAWVYYEGNEYIKVIELLEKSIDNKETFESDALTIEAYQLLGDSYTRIEIPDYDKAIKLLSHCGEYYHEGYSYYRLSLLYEKNEKYRDFDKARKCLFKAADYSNFAAIRDLAWKYLFGDESYKIEESKELAVQMISRLDGKNRFRELYTLTDFYSVCFSKTSNHGRDIAEKVTEYYEKMVSVATDDDWAQCQNQGKMYSIVGKAYREAGNSQRAIELLGKAYESGNREFSDTYGLLLRQKGQISIGEFLTYEKEHFEEYGQILDLVAAIEYSEDTYDSGRYEDCFAFVSKSFEMTNDSYFYRFIAKEIIYGKIPEQKDYKISEIVSTLESLYDQQMEEKDGETDSSLAEIAILLGYHYSSLNILWKAVNWYIKAFQDGDASAAFQLGRIYEQKSGTFKADLNIAYEWYCKGAEKGNIACREEMRFFKKTLLRGMVRM